MSFDNDTTRNVIIFDVDNSSSSHGHNRRNNFLVLGFGSPEGKFSINFTKANTK